MIFPSPIMKCVLRLTIVHGVLPHALPITEQRFAMRFPHCLAFCLTLFPHSLISVLPCALPVVSHLPSPFDHPLAFAFSFSVLSSALPIIERFATGFLFCVIVNDKHGDKLRQDFDRKCMDLSGFIFIVIMNDTHLDKL